MTLTVYHLKTCDTCRNAIKALKAADHDLTLVDIRADGIDPETLIQIEAVVGWHKLLNKRSTTWKQLSESEQAGLDREKTLGLMNAHPTLIKRPVIDTGDDIFVGWTKDVQAELL